MSLAFLQAKLHSDTVISEFLQTAHKKEYFNYTITVCMYVCMPFYVVHYHNNLMKAHHYHKSHQISSAGLEK